MSARSRRALASFALLATGLMGGGLTLGFAPAAVLPAAGAATCTSTGGVSVVVDYRELGGSTVTACAPDGGGKSAAAIFESVGVTISYATRQPGFVCRVNGVPTSDPCVNASPANAYWGLWWADGSKASWTYSSAGVGSLTVPAGGSVGWSWQQDRPAGGSVPPSVAPPVTRTTTSPSPTPTQSPTPSPTSSPTSSSPTASPSGGSGSSGGTGSSSPTPTASPSPTKGGGSSGSTGGSTPTSSPQASPSGSPTAPSESPLGNESPSDSKSKSGAGKGSKGSALDVESPSDSTSSEDADPSETTVESPSDSTPSAAPEAGPPTPDEPARVPAAVTWSIVGLLALAIATSAVVARRRRGV